MKALIHFLKRLSPNHCCCCSSCCNCGDNCLHCKDCCSIDCCKK